MSSIPRMFRRRRATLDEVLTERLANAVAKELEPRDRPYLPTEDSR